MNGAVEYAPAAVHLPIDSHAVSGPDARHGPRRNGSLFGRPHDV